MNTILVRELKDHLGSRVLLKGWAYNLRSSGKIAFIQFRDGTGRVQAVFSRSEVDEACWEQIQQTTIESSVLIEGTIKAESRAPSGVEIAGAVFTLVARAAEYPIGKKEHGPDFLLDQRHLWIRTEAQAAILRVRNEIEFSLRKFFYERGFVLADSPIFTPNACEGTSELFEVSYFERKAYLSQSGQLYQEATSAALGKTYCFGPTFRSEKSKTRRHLTEFWMLEAEASYMGFEENMRLQEEMMVAVLEHVLTKSRVEFAVLKRDIASLEIAAQGKFPRLHYSEAVEKVRRLGSAMKPGDDFGAEDETILTKQYDRPIFIHHYPVEVKAFYMKPDPQEPAFALNSDLLAPEGYGEIAGGSERIDDLALLEQKIKEHKLPVEAFQWYLDLRRYGSVPHSGFGLGLERAVGWICGTHHVRETIPFPRLMNRIEP